MRLRLKLTSLREKKCLPFNYAYPLSGWIYRIFTRADREYADWLHNCGHQVESKKFKLFTFSQILPQTYKIKPDHILITSRQAELILSFYLDKTMEKFIIGLFQQQQFSIGNARHRAEFRVESVEALPLPDFTSTMNFKATTPICISRSEIRNGRKLPQYLSPTEPDYAEYFSNNLFYKYKAAQPEKSDPDRIFDIKSNFTWALPPECEPKSRLITIKAGSPEESKIRGYVFPFQITASPLLLKLGYLAGFGEKNSLGFGFTDVDIDKLVNRSTD